MKQNRNKTFESIAKYTQAINGQNNPLLPVAFEKISEYENHPSPEELNGIDLKELYKWMANLFAGFPVDIKEGPTKDFLNECYKVSCGVHRTVVSRYMTNCLLF